MRSSGTLHDNKLKELFATNEDIHQLLRKVQESYAGGDGAQMQAAQELLTSELAKHGLQVNKIESKGNNTNYVVQSEHVPDEKVVIQIRTKSPYAQESIEKLSNPERPAWLVECYFETKSPATGPLQNKDEQVVLSVIEFCPLSLEKLVERMNNRKDDAERIAIAGNIVSQLSEMMTEMQQKGLLWVDLKPGNVLLDANLRVILSDDKTIIDPDLLPRWESGKQFGDGTSISKGAIKYGDISKTFLSEYFRLNKLDNVLDIKESRQDWSREYSYQLAVMLHYMLTGGEPRTSEFFLDKHSKTEFDFSHTIFATEQGQRLQYLIEKLGAHKPYDRMPYVDAVEMLKVIDDAKEFDERELAAEKLMRTFKRSMLKSPVMASKSGVFARPSVDVGSRKAVKAASSSNKTKSLPVPLSERTPKPKRLFLSVPEPESKSEVKPKKKGSWRAKRRDSSESDSTSGKSPRPGKNK